MDIAISGQLLSGAQDLDTILGTIARHGVRLVELWPENFSGRGDGAAPWLYRGKDHGAVRSALDAFGLTAVCVTLSGGLTRSLRADGPAAAARAVVDAVDAAAAVGSPRVNTYLGGLEIDRYADIVRPAVDYAAGLGVTVVLENEAHDDSGTVDGLERIVAAVDRPNFGLVFDPCNFYHAGEEPFPFALDRLGPHVRYAHFKGGCLDWPGLSVPSHPGTTLRDHDDQRIAYVAIGHSAFNPLGCLAGLAAIGYDGPVTVEPHVAVADADWFYEQDVRFLRDALERLDRVPAAVPG